MKSCGLGLLAALILVSGGGCKKSASEAGHPQSLITNLPPVLAQVHWLGKKRIAAETNAARFMSLWNLPESAALERQTLDKLALALTGVSRATNVGVQLPLTNSLAALTNFHAMGTNYAALVSSHPAAALLRPLLDDLVREEWYLEIQQAANPPGELALAIRLDEPRAALWTSNLSAVLGSVSNVQSLPAPANGHAWRLPFAPGPAQHNGTDAPRPSRFDLARAGDWTLVGLASEHNTRLDDFAARIQRGQTPVAAPETGSALQMDPVTRKVRPAPSGPAATFWIEADLDLRRISSALALGWNLPGALPKMSLAIAGDDLGVRTRAHLDFPGPVPLEMEAWNIPTNLIHDPLIGFAAVRGIRPWLKPFKPWQDLQLGTPPNQAYFWAQYGMPNKHFMAAPSAETSNQLNKLSEFVLRELNPILATNAIRMGIFVRPTNSSGVAWQGLPLFTPRLDYADSGSNRFLVAGLARGWTTNWPAPDGLFQRLETSPNLVAYDWEYTKPCLEGWIRMGQLAQHAFSLPRLNDTAGLAWLVALPPRLTNSITVVELSSPSRLSLARTSSAGFTGAELEILADWLESFEFPRGLHTFTAPPPPPLRSSPTNAPAPPR